MALALAAFPQVAVKFSFREMNEGTQSQVNSSVHHFGPTVTTVDDVVGANQNKDKFDVPARRGRKLRRQRRPSCTSTLHCLKTLLSADPHHLWLVTHFGFEHVHLKLYTFSICLPLPQGGLPWASVEDRTIDVCARSLKSVTHQRRHQR